MGSIKNNARSDKSKAHELTEEEFNYVMNVNVAKQNIVNEYNRVMSAFLKYVASSRLGYTSDEDLEFELDFSAKEHLLKIKKIPKQEA